MIIDGRKLATKILARIEERAADLPHPPRIAVIVANETPATRSYLAIKEKRAQGAGCRLEVIRLPESASALELRLAVDAAQADAIVVQLPLPEGVNAKEVCDAIPLAKDADVLSTASRMRFEADAPAENGGLRNPLIPPVAGALAEILRTNDINPAGKRAVVLGDGWLVGRPCATWLTHAGADVIHLRTFVHDLTELRLADIIVSGLGSPHLIKPEMLKEGIVLVDAGTSESGGKLAGDADPACAATCALFTPVPGGVGPIAVAKLFENVVTLAEQNIDKSRNKA
ncbi:MAG: bifunctional 5,10-methylenetetrahydrofolate dehydrogenase/5,10-methenyltetrahydrofolate cyclohydrolase [bacterium]|nr:bifunctional 5,10-methylenetetrahydrofolate dehydrogenase/5,10-methenyltetrahydrofolate cyclohydrolase [bacterium]